MPNQDSFREFAGLNGYEVPDYIPVEKWVRIPAKGKKGSNKSASVRMFSDGNALIRDFTTGEDLHYFASSKPLTAKDKKAYKDELLQRKNVEAEFYQKAVVMSSNYAKALYSYGVRVKNDFPYLVKKAIGSHGIKLLSKDVLLPEDLQMLMPYLLGSDLLMIPKYSSERYLSGEVQAIEFIKADGTKLPPLKSKPKGTFFPIWGDAEKILICEGFATGATLKERYAQNETVIVAFNAGNLLLVAKYFRSLFPQSDIVIAGDNDFTNKKNIGKDKAILTAQIIGGRYSIPEFKPGEIGSDWNDRYLLDCLNPAGGLQ